MIKINKEKLMKDFDFKVESVKYYASRGDLEMMHFCLGQVEAIASLIEDYNSYDVVVTHACIIYRRVVEQVKNDVK